MNIRTKRIVYTALSVALILLIFGFSGQNADESNDLSTGFIKKIIDSNILFFLTEAQEEFLLNNSVYVRKAAHFTEFALLGVSLYMTFSVWLDSVKYKPYIYSSFVCLLVAITDELSQIMSEGRTPHIRDVVIDFSGGVTACIVIILIKMIKNKKIFGKILVPKIFCYYYKYIIQT